MNMLEEDIIGHNIQKEELIERRKALQQEMEGYKKKYPEELKLFYEELRIEEQIENVQEEKAKIMEKEKINESKRLSIVKKLRENEELNESLQKQIDASDENLKSFIAGEEEDIAKLESTLAQNIENNSLDKAILQEALKRGFNHEKRTFAFQLKLIDKEINQVLVSNFALL